MTKAGRVPGSHSNLSARRHPAKAREPGVAGNLRPRDMIDMQSFLWVQGSDEYPD